MTKAEMLEILVTERYSGPVREYRAAGRSAPVAEMLDVLRDLIDDEPHLTVAREVS